MDKIREEPFVILWNPIICLKKPQKKPEETMNKYQLFLPSTIQTQHELNSKKKFIWTY